jgi:glutathione S-transferase
MKLYSFPGSCALGANIALEWIGQPYELQLVQKDDLASPAIRALNPNGQVPILVDDGWALNENAAILNYLADKFPDA